MSKKIRISELAQEINSNNKRVMELLARIGINVSNASSTLTEEQVDKFYESINFKRPEKTEKDDAEADAGQNARETKKDAQTQTAAGKEARQAQPVIRKVVVHSSSAKADAQTSRTPRQGTAQAPSGLRQGLAVQKNDGAAPAGTDEAKETAPAKTGGVRRIPRPAARTAAQTDGEAAASGKTEAEAGNAGTSAAGAAAAGASGDAGDNAAQKPAVKRIRRVEKAPADEADTKDVPSVEAADASGKSGTSAKSDAPDGSASDASGTQTDPATAQTPADAKTDAKTDSHGQTAKAEKSDKTENAAETAGAKDAPEKSARSAEAEAVEASAAASGASNAAAAQQAGVNTAASAPVTEKAADAGRTAGAASPAAPVRRGPVYISRARDNAGAQPADQRRDGRFERRTDRTDRPDRPGERTGQTRPFGRDDQRPGQRIGGYPQRDGAPRQGGAYGGQNRGRGPSIPSVNPAVAQQEPRRDYAGKLFDKGEKNAEKTQKPAGRKDVARGGGAKVKYREERNMVGATIGVNDLYADNYHAGYDPDDTHAQKRSARTGRRDAKQSGADVRAAQQAASALTSVTLPASMTVKEFAEFIKKTAAEVIKKLMLMGTMATQNQVIDFETAQLIASEFGIEAEQEVVITDEERLFDDGDDYNDEAAVERPPVVVVMGHVDHGKTSLLDAIRSTSVTSAEAGGITQHIGAYMVRIGDRKITFLDTPGHEAFTAMRQRGAMVTDVAILVVAADDGVMPQTVEAINHAKAAKVSIVVAVNKMDKEGANLERVMTELAKYDVVSEDWGGDVPFVPVSAKTGMNIQLLLETVLLSADVLQLKANPERQAKGTIIEAKLDKNKGAVATLLVQRGTLRTGDAIVSGITFGRVRTMTDDKGKAIKKAGPSTPVEITGLPEVPEAGEVFYVVEDEHLAKHLVESRRSELREKSLQSTAKVSLENLNSFIEAGKMKDLNIIIKADVVGSVEAVKQSLQKLSNEEVRINIIHGAVGAITESDVSLADVSNAIIIGFNVRPGANISESAKAAGVDIKLYRVIYDAIDDIKAAISGMLSPKYQEIVRGHASVRQTFKVSNVGTIAGAYVTDGDIVRNSEVRIVRDGIVVFEGKLASLKRFKDDVKEVASGYECGLSFENYNDIKIGDVVECYTMEEVKKA